MDSSGALRFAVLDNGNVGIGTTAPGSALGVSGAVAIGSTYALGAAPSNGLAVSGNVGIGTSTPSQLFQVNANGSSPVVITSGGNVGIGNSNPSARLG